VGQDSTSITIEVLIPIWERVLQRQSIRADDDFFELGGTPSSAAQICREIALISGRELSPVTIVQAPTIDSLAALLRGSRTPKLPLLIKLKHGEKQPPIFVRHGVGGSMMEIFQFARAIESQHAIFGMQSVVFEEHAEPSVTVEALARVYLDAMKQLQPRGPYGLIGYSFGGLVMMEIAQRLHESGESVALLAMVDSYPHRRFLPMKMRLDMYARLARHHAGNLSKLPTRQKIAYLSRTVRRFYASQEQTGIVPSNGSVVAPALDGQPREWAALKSYQPRFYNGKVNFVKAATDIPAFPPDARGVWEGMAEEFELDTVSSDHFGLVTTHYRELASVLSRWLASALSGG
jgi:thioesterase domain-containing protein